MTDTNRGKADEIEQDIVKTQNNISDTMDQIKERLTPQSLMNSILGDDKPGFDQIVDAARRNPLAVGLIGAGAILLATGKSVSMPSFGRVSDGQNGATSAKDSVSDPHHQGYVDHMARMEMRENEPPHLYQQRRDAARADYFMLERSHDEDDASFRKRLDDAGESLRSRTSAFGHQTRARGHDLKQGLASAGSATREQARAAADKTRQIYDDNPVVGGLFAAVAGALAGVTFPATRIEQEKLSSVANSAMSKAGEQKDKLIEKAAATLDPPEPAIADGDPEPSASEPARPPF